MSVPIGESSAWGRGIAHPFDGKTVRGKSMKTRTFAIAGAAGMVAAVTVAAQVRAGGDKVVFPENYAKGVLYTTVDRADNKQYRELYTSPEAVAAAKEGKPLPSGTVITLVQ